MPRIRILAQVVLAAAFTAACVAERSFPEPAQMCKDLVSSCGNPQIGEYGGVEECFDIGRAGASDARNEDQCFAVYDECISDCEYYSFLLSFYTDAGPDTRGSTESGGPADASSGDASSDGTMDAGATESERADAATSLRDE